MMNASIYSLLIVLMGGLSAVAAPTDEVPVPDRQAPERDVPPNANPDARPLRRPKADPDSATRPRRDRREDRAEPGRGRQTPPRQRDRARPAPEGWKRLDQNGDGRVGYDEFAANKRLAKVPEERKREIFKRIDKNGDGWIQPHEMIPPGHGPHNRGMGLREFDTNQNGSISYKEFARGRMVARFPEEKRRALFKRMDRNGDGVLSPLDRPERGPHPPPRHQGKPAAARPHAPIAEMDRNQNGGVDFREFSSGENHAKLPEKRRRALFNQLDRDGDGEIRRNETPDWGKPKATKAKEREHPESKRPQKKKEKKNAETQVPPSPEAV